jgi:hypothetical protein
MSQSVPLGSTILTGIMKGRFSNPLPKTLTGKQTERNDMHKTGAIYVHTHTHTHTAYIYIYI